MTRKIGILDLKVGNYHAVQRVVNAMNCETETVSSHNDLRGISGLIVPGVGNFEEIMTRIDELDLRSALVDYIEGGHPYLGICSGYQILFENSDESALSGLGVVKQKIYYLGNHRSNLLKIPNIGWHSVDSITSSEKLRRGRYYFCHSYAATSISKDFKSSSLNFGQLQIIVEIKKDALHGVQYHPEKSFDDGRSIFQMFLDTVQN